MSQPTKRKKRTNNPIARILKYFTPKRFKDKTKYTRKVKHGKNKIYSSGMGT